MSQHTDSQVPKDDSSSSTSEFNEEEEQIQFSQRIGEPECSQEIKKHDAPKPKRKPPQSTCHCCIKRTLSTRPPTDD